MDIRAEASGQRLAGANIADLQRRRENELGICRRKLSITSEECSGVLPDTPALCSENASTILKVVVTFVSKIGWLSLTLVPGKSKNE